jgi:hypothetical protein
MAFDYLFNDIALLRPARASAHGRELWVITETSWFQETAARFAQSYILFE